MARAYRQIPVAAPHLGFSIIMVWNMDLEKWQFGILHGLCFGLLSAVLQFNRYPAFLVAVARRWLAIPVINFFDDFKISEPSYAKDSGAYYFDKLVRLLGWLFDPDKDKAPSLTPTFLGGLEDYTVRGRVQLRPVQARLAKTVAKLEQVVQGHLSKQDALSLHGKLAHFSAFCVGRTGRGQLQVFSDFAADPSRSPMPLLSRAAEFYIALFRLCPWRDVSLLPNTLPRLHVYTDASCEPQPPLALPKVQLCYLIFNWASGERLGGVCRVPDRVLKSFTDRDTYIAQGEALAPLLALLQHPEAVAHANCLWFLDNLGVLSGLIVGRSVIADFGSLLHAFHLCSAKLSLTNWFEHVDSHANPSDGGSREGVTCPIAKELGFTLQEVPFPALWPDDVLAVRPLDWPALLFTSAP